MIRHLAHTILGVHKEIESLKHEAEQANRKTAILQSELDSIRQVEQNDKYPKELVYTDSDRNNYFVFVGNDMPNSRKVMIQNLIESMRFGIEPDDLFANLDKLSLKAKRLNKDNVDVESINLIAELAKLKAKTAHVIQPNLYLQVALASTRMKDEPDNYTELWMQKKSELWAKDKDAQYFFLCWVGNALNESRNYSPISVQNYLLENRLKIKKYQPIL